MIETIALPLAIALGGVGVVLPGGTSGDCNGNGVADAVEIHAEPHLDTNQNGKLDYCEGFSVESDRISLSQGGNQRMKIMLGPVMAGRIYWVLGSVAGATPGLKVHAASLPLNWDGPAGYMAITLGEPNGSFLANGFGVLGINGDATPVFTVPAGFDPAFVGMTVHHAYMILGPDFQTFIWASNAVSVRLEP